MSLLLDKPGDLADLLISSQVGLYPQGIFQNTERCHSKSVSKVTATARVFDPNLHGTKSGLRGGSLLWVRLRVCGCCEDGIQRIWH